MSHLIGNELPPVLPPGHFYNCFVSKIFWSHNARKNFDIKASMCLENQERVISSALKLFGHIAVPTSKTTVRHTCHSCIRHQKIEKQLWKPEAGHRLPVPWNVILLWAINSVVKISTKIVGEFLSTELVAPWTPQTNSLFKRQHFTQSSSLWPFPFCQKMVFVLQINTSLEHFTAQHSSLLSCFLS